MIKVAEFDEFTVYKYDNNNMYIKYKETDDVYTVIGYEYLKISDYLKEKLFS